MAAEIYNEGRAVGLSAYEIYVKQFLLENPDGQPASEKEWLAASVASGASVLVQIPSKTALPDEYHYMDIPLESDTNLRAANTIVATLTNIEPDSVYTTLGTIDQAASTLIPGSISVPTRGLILSVAISDALSSQLRSNIKFHAQGDSELFTTSNVNDAESITYLNSFETLVIENYSMSSTIPSGSLAIEYANCTKVISYSNTLVPNYFGFKQAQAGQSWESDNYFIHIGGNEYVPLTVKPDSFQSSDYYVIDTSSGIYPSGDDVPVSDIETDLEDYTGLPTKDVIAIQNYLKIKDGVILQPGNWVHNPDDQPAADFYPDLSKSPTIRLLIKGTISEPFYILFTGFTDAGVLAGISSTDSSLTSPNPQNGDFLGPAVYPWANKIIFSINNYILQGISDNLQDITYHAVSPTTINTGVKYIKLMDSDLMVLPRTSFAESPATALPNDSDAGSGYISWSQLFRALPNDDKIKIVSDMLDTLQSKLSINANTNFETATGYGIKVSKNYIDFNGLRLYVSSSPIDEYTPLNNTNLVYAQNTYYERNYTDAPSGQAWATDTYYEFIGGLSGVAFNLLTTEPIPFNSEDYLIIDSNNPYTLLTSATDPQFWSNSTNMYFEKIPDGSIGIGWSPAS